MVQNHPCRYRHTGARRPSEGDAHVQQGLTGPERGAQLSRPSGRGAQPAGDQRVDRAHDVVGQEQAQLVLGLAERVVTAADGAPELLLLERRIFPRPQEVGADSPSQVELQRAQVLRRVQRRRHGRGVPERGTREQPGGAVVGGRGGIGTAAGRCRATQARPRAVSTGARALAWCRSPVPRPARRHSRPAERPRPARESASRPPSPPRASEGDAEGDERRVGSDQPGALEEWPRQVDADGAARDAEPDARPAEAGAAPSERIATADADEPLVAEVHAEAHLGGADLAPWAVDVGSEADVEAIAIAATRERAEAYRVDRAHHDAGGERVGLVAVVDLQLKADVAHGDPDAQRAARADGELAADVERVGDPAAGRDLAAVAAAVDAELDELVADAEGEGGA